MKTMKIFTYVVIFCSVLLTLSAKDVDTNNQDMIYKQIKKEMEKEKKYSREQTFYSSDRYDFHGSQVNPESLKSLPEIEVDDLDMNSVYD